MALSFSVVRDLIYESYHHVPANFMRDFIFFAVNSDVNNIYFKPVNIAGIFKNQDFVYVL